PVRAVRDGPRRQGSARSGGPAADPHRAVLRRLAPPGGPRGPPPAETERSLRTGALHRAGRSGYASSMAEIDDVLARAADGGRIGAEEAELLYTEAPFHALAEAADTVRRRVIGDNIVTYIIDRNINYTNVCVTACKFCAFYRAPKHEEGWEHSLEEILRRCGEAVELGATQVMLQGGHHPEF